MSRDPLAPIGDGFEQALGELAAIFGSIFLFVFVLLVIAISQAVIENQQRNSQPSFGLWEEPMDTSGLWWPDGGLNLGEAIQWQ